MALTFEQLRTPITQDEALQTILDELASLGFNSTSWQSGSVQRTIITAMAEVWARISEGVAFLAEMGFNETSTSGGLTLFSDSHYDNQRVEAVATEGLMLFTGSAIGPPHTISVGGIVVKEETTGIVYRNTAGGTIPASGSISLAMQADTPGIAGNIPNLSTLKLSTPYTGVTATNPDPGSGTWITTQGIDEEADVTLRARNRTKWATLNFALPADAYVNLSLTSDSDITRVTVDDSNPRGAGTLDVYIARATGIAVAGDVTTVQTEIDKKRPVTADPLVIAAAAQTVTISGTIHITTALHDAAKEAEIEQAAIDYTNSLPIGGEIVPPGTTGYFIFSELITAISRIEGVRRVALVSPTADIAISGFSVATVSGGTPAFTYVDID